MLNDYIDFNSQIGRCRLWHENGKPVVVTAFNLKADNPYSDLPLLSGIPLVAVEVRPADTIFRDRSNFYHVPRETWERTIAQNSDTWDIGPQGEVLTGKERIGRRT